MSETCRICGSNNIKIEYEGIIRDGGLGKYTHNKATLYRCEECNVIWHDAMINLDEYYQSDNYRLSLEGTVDEDDFYNLHDRESIDKLLYTGMVFRNKTVADIGCGCGSFLDLISGLTKEIIAVEPTQKYREILKKKKYNTYTYAKDAIKEWNSKVDIVVSFDVIEHVDSPVSFMKDIFEMLRPGGKAIIGTPTETPVMRRLLGTDYEMKVLFSTQHLWVFGEKNLKKMAGMAGFKDDHIDVRYYQRYGLENVFGWLKNKQPGGSIDDSMITRTMDYTWRHELENQGLSDYIVIYIEK